MKRPVLTFGLIAGAVMSAMLLVTLPFRDSISGETGMIIGYTGMIAAFLGVYFGVRAYRDQTLGGSIGFGKALTVGLLITAIATTCYVVTWEVIYFKLAPDYKARMLEMGVERAKASDKPSEQVAKDIVDLNAFIANYDNPLYNVAITFVEPLPVGLVYSLISAALLSRKKREATA
jgi:hypothetical protein